MVASELFARKKRVRQKVEFSLCVLGSSDSLSPPVPSSPTTMPALSHILYESASGYALFQVALHDEVANSTKQFQDSVADLHKFGQMVTLKSFAPFQSAAHALENANDVSEGTFDSAH